MATELEARQRSLESVLGRADSTHIHAPVPFDLGFDIGGRPDMLTWSDYHPDATLFVTCDLLGRDEQPSNRDGQYELAVLQPNGQDWAVDIVRRLAFYTLDSPINHGETMDIGPATPQGSDIVAFLFRRLARFEAFGKPASVLCCVGITAPELDYALDEGTDALYESFPGEYLLTTKIRTSFV